MHASKTLTRVGYIAVMREKVKAIILKQHVVGIWKLEGEVREKLIELVIMTSSVSAPNCWNTWTKNK